MVKSTDTKWDFNGLSLNYEELKYWNEEIRCGIEFRKKHFADTENKTGKAYDGLNYYLGNQDILKEGIDTPIVDNQIAPIVNAFTAALLFQNPEIIVKEKAGMTYQYQSEITKAVFKYFQEELKMEWHNHQCLFDSYVTGLGVKNNGYYSEFDETEEKSTVKEKVSKRKGLGRGKGWQTVEEEVEREIVKRKEWITKEFPFNLRHSPFMCVVDPRSKSSLPYDGKWICLEYDVSYNEVKANKAFKNTEDLTPSGAVGTDKDKLFSSDTEKGMCRIHQLQIGKKDGLYLLTMAKGYDKPLRYVKFPFDIEGFLTKFLTLNDTCDYFYPPSDLGRLLPLQDEVNWIQSKILEAIYKFLPKIGVNMENVKDETEFLNACEKGDIATIMKFTKEPNASVQTLQFTLNLTDKLTVLNTLKAEMKMISGVTEAELTGSTDARTATEANIGARGFSARILAKREKLRRFLREDLRIFKQIVQQACDNELITKISGIKEIDPETGELATERWVKLNRIKDYVLGEYDLDLDLTSAQQPNQEMKRQQILLASNFLFSPIVQQNLASEGMKIDYTLMTKEFLRTMDQFRSAPNLIVPLTPSERKDNALKEAMASPMGQQMMKNKMAMAPQTGTPPQGEAHTTGELTASVLGSAGG
jgi:hypothetical protein